MGAQVEALQAPGGRQGPQLPPRRPAQRSSKCSHHGCESCVRPPVVSGSYDTSVDLTLWSHQAHVSAAFSRVYSIILKDVHTHTHRETV